MNRRVLLLNLVLLIAAGGLVWTVRARVVEARSRERATLERAVPPKPIVPLPPAPQPAPARPTDYANVAQQMLFSSDRNPNVILPPPPAPPPPKPVPPMPAVYGAMSAFGDHVVILGEGNGPAKSYRKGDQIGPFKIVDFDSDKITFDWDGKEIEKTLKELMAKTQPPPPTQPAASQAPQQAPSQQSAAAVPGKLGGTAELSSKPADDQPQLGVDMGGPRACVAGDNSPDGTVVGKYRKVLTNFLGMKQCHWEPIK